MTPMLKCLSRLEDDLQEAEVQVAFETNENIGCPEGSRFYKINESYFLWMTWHNGGMGNLSSSLRTGCTAHTPAEILAQSSSSWEIAMVYSTLPRRLLAAKSWSGTLLCLSGHSDVRPRCVIQSMHLQRNRDCTFHGG